MSTQPHTASLAEGLLVALRAANTARPVLAPDEINDHAEHIDHADRHTRGINDFVAAEVSDMQPAMEPIARQDLEPHGMFWFRGHPSAPPILKAHAWFYNEVSTTAEQVLAHASQLYAKDSDLRERINEMAAALRDYVQSRNAINNMAGDRKLKNEADDACYQLCQAAKFYIDAIERTQHQLARGAQLDNNAQIERLRNMSEESMREGYAIAQAVVIAADGHIKFNFDTAAKRVVDWSCKRLTEWFAAKRQNQDRAQRLSNAATAVDIAGFLSKFR